MKTRLLQLLALVVLFDLLLLVSPPQATPILAQATRATIRVSVASDGTQGNFNSRYPALSADGRYAAFSSYASNLVSGELDGVWDTFVHDMQTRQTTLVSVASDGTHADGSSWSGTLSGDGRYVAFVSSASNLVTDDTNNRTDVFVHDTQTRQTTRVSVASDGTEGDNGAYDSSLSADGRYTAFMSHATNLVSGDTNGKADVFVHDMQT